MLVIGELAMFKLDCLSVDGYLRHSLSIGVGAATGRERRENADVLATPL
jgi:hypothetical protein